MYCVVSVAANDVTEPEFTTYDVTRVHLYADDGRRLDSTEIAVGY